MAKLPTGEPGLGAAQAAKPKTCGLAIASVICAIAGLLTGGLGAALGVVLAVAGIRKINRQPDQLRGKRLAFVGLLASSACVFLGFGAAMKAYDVLMTALASRNFAYLGYVTVGYAANHEDCLPPPTTWPEAYFGTDGFVSAPGNEAMIFEPGNRKAGRAVSMNALLDGVKLHDIQNKSKTVLFFECAFGSPPSGGKELLPPKPRHAGKYFIGFCDGHAEAMEPEQVNQLIWDPNAATPGP